MQHADFFTAIVTLAPVFLAAGLYSLRDDLRRRPQHQVGWPTWLLLTGFIVTFAGSLLTLGDLANFRDNAPTRWVMFAALTSMAAVGAGGFLVQAVGEEPAEEAASS